MLNIAIDRKEAELAQGLQSLQVAIQGDQAQMLAGRAMLNAMGARMPGMRRAYELMLAESHDHERAVRGALHALSSGQPDRLQRALESLADHDSPAARAGVCVH